MRNRFKLLLTSYGALYWISTLLIILLCLGLIISNNLSSMPANRMMKDALADSDQIKENLSKTKESFAAYDIMLNRMAESLYSEDDWIDAFYKQAAILFDGFFAMHPFVSGYFINIDDENSYPLLQKYYDFKTTRESHISVYIDSSFIYGRGGLNDLLAEYEEPLFVAVPSSFVGSFELSYVVPMNIYGEYRGLFGIVLDKESLSTMFGGNANDGRQMMLLTSDLEIIASTDGYPVGSTLNNINRSRYAPISAKILERQSDTGYIRENHNGQSWMYIYVNLPSGQVFLESFKASQWLLPTNLYIILLVVLAVFCIWFVTKKDGTSPFDHLASSILNKMRGISEESQIANKASFSIHIAIIFVTLALFAFSLIGGAGVKERIAFAAFFLITVASLFWYQRAVHNFFNKCLYLGFFLLAPVIMHHVTGGFSSQNAGQIIIFSVMALMMSVFVLRDKKKMGMFPLFVVVLFVSTIIELISVDISSPDCAVRFITIVFFLGFAVFLSTDLYVVGVIDSFARLKDAQSILVQKEKMVTLGRLIAGVAHEINTPLGAIKASVESIESALNPVFTALMDAGHELSEQDRTLFYRLFDMAAVSMENMYSTIQIRKAKPMLLEFFTELGYDSPQDIVNTLVRLEICNVDLLRENQDIFESENLQKLLSLLAKTAPVMRSTYIISQSTAKTSKIVFALKSYSHTTLSSDPIWLNVVQNIDNVLVLLYNQLKIGIDVVREYDEDIPEILGNPDELSQIWINLIQNSIYAMDGSGTLTVGIKLDDDFVCVSIEDSGCGIAPEAIDHIFEPFYTTKAVGEGSGLGLDICKKIILAHHGTISVHSELEVGTVFYIRFPVNPVEDNEEKSGE